jgi:hypothetical protein
MFWNRPTACACALAYVLSIVLVISAQMFVAERAAAMLS